MILTDKTLADKKIKRVLFTEEEIKSRIKLAGRKLSEEYEGKPLLIVGILTGSFMFVADLCKEITIPCEITFMGASSYYSGTTSTGEVRITKDISQKLSDYHVLIAEDIIDTGRTLKQITQMLREREPLSLKVITLLDKPERREVDFDADMSLFTIPDHFVVGYGLDCADYYRNLPYIAEYAE